jgi:hypothetical protein
MMLSLLEAIQVQGVHDEELCCTLLYTVCTAKRRVVCSVTIYMYVSQGAACTGSVSAILRVLSNDMRCC